MKQTQQAKENDLSKTKKNGENSVKIYLPKQKKIYHVICKQ